jgi:hypothetical protein
MPTISELRTALRYPSEAAPPDTDAIIRRGRRQRHLHQALAGAATAVVLVAAGVATLGLRPGGSSEPSPAPSNAPSLAGPDPVTGTRPNPLLVAASSRLDAQAPDRFDPRVRTLHVGWIPDGLTRELSMITATSQEYGALGPDGTGILVIVLAHAVPASQLPSGQIGMPDNASSIVVGPEFAVRGRPAHCLSDPRVPGSCFAIQWQYADGAWARASYASPAETPVEETNEAVRRLVESVTLADPEPVRLPFTLTGELAGRQVIVSMVAAGGSGPAGKWYGSVELAPAGVEPTPGGPTIFVEANRVDPTADPGHTADQIPNTTVDGQPAWASGDGRAVVLFPQPDLRVLCELRATPGDPRAYTPDIHLVATPDTLTTWV